MARYFELQLRHCLADYMANITQQYSSEEDPWFVNFFKFSTNCVKAKIAGNQTILLLFEDLFENCPEKSI